MRDPLTTRQCATEIFDDCVSPFSVRRWIVKGVGIPKVKLPATRMGRDYFIEREDALAFREAINTPELYQRRQQTERAEKAKKRLQEAGA